MKQVRFTSLEKAKELLQTEDSFTKSWSQFDIDARMGKLNSTKKELLQYICLQAQEWTSKEEKKMSAVLEIISNKIEEKKLQLDIPEEIYFIKSTTKEEGGAQGYTRANYIVIKNNIEDIPEKALASFITHELFHVLSRYNNAFRKRMYKIIGFELMPNKDYPARIRAKRITNPDATQTDCFIELNVKDKKVKCMMILYADKEYEGGRFFEYLNVGFLDLDKKHVIYGQKEVSNFFEQIGKNTQYIIHPEEIMADNFSYMLFDKEELPDPWITQSILKQLQNKCHIKLISTGAQEKTQR